MSPGYRGKKLPTRTYLVNVKGLTEHYLFGFSFGRNTVEIQISTSHVVQAPCILLKDNRIILWTGIFLSVSLINVEYN